MKRVANILVIVIILIAAFFLTCFEIVPLDRVGVRSNQLGSGVEKRDLSPGLWMIIPGIHKLTIMDPTVQRLTFADDSPHGPLRLRTKDQYTTQVDVTLFYRIKPGNAWDILLKMGPGYAFKERFRQQAEASIWKVMGNMKTEDFYNSAVRSASAEETVRVLNESLKEYLFDLDTPFRGDLNKKELSSGLLTAFAEHNAPLNNNYTIEVKDRNDDWFLQHKEGVDYHVTKGKDGKLKVYSGSNLEVLNILIRKVVFDPRFEQKLIDKQLLEQKELLAESQTLREEEQRETEMIKRETEAKVLAIQEEMKKEIMELKAQTGKEIKEISANAQLKVRKLKAEADRYKREKIAEGEKLKEIARAVGEKAINEAYQGVGGRLLLSRKMIENMEIGNVVINTNQTNPFDISHFLELIGAQGKGLADELPSPEGTESSEEESELSLEKAISESEQGASSEEEVSSEEK